MPGAQATPSSPHIGCRPHVWLTPCAYRGPTLYAAWMACGEKQRRPADAHCACVGGVVLVLIWTKSLTTGCMTTAAAAGTMAVPGKARTEPATPATRRRKPRVRNLTISTPPVHGRFMDTRFATLKKRR